MFCFLALVSECNCFFRSRCSMEMWCPENDLSAGVPLQPKDEVSTDPTALEKKGLDRKTNHQGVMKVETRPIPMRPPP